MKWRVISGVQIVVRNKSKPCEEPRPELAHGEHPVGTEGAITVLAWGLRDRKQREHLGSSFSSSNNGNSDPVLAVCWALFSKRFTESNSYIPHNSPMK